MGTRVTLYDTTLRDGMQGEGMSLSVEEKLRVAQRLDELGIHLIEAGFPGSNPKEQEFFKLLTSEPLKRAEVCAFGMTRRRGIRAEEDHSLRWLVESDAPACTLVGKTWALHLEKVTKVDPRENLEMISDSVAFLVSGGKRVIYDAEHFFDGFITDPKYATECVRAAAEAGAENVTLCDTNGASLPSTIGRVVESVRVALPDLSIGIHAHNDADCAVANSIVAVQAGADLVQGTMNGYGERCGNANMVSVIPALQLKLGLECISSDRLRELADAAHFVDDICNVGMDPNQPYVGRNAFAHKGGMHVAGVVEDSRTFEHVDPAAVGNQRELLISELSGKGALATRASDAGLDVTDAEARRLLSRLKALEHRGYHYEAADASFEILVRKELGAYEPLFQFESLRVINDMHADGRVRTEATIKIHVGDRRVIRTAEGNGPVNALDSALREAIQDTYPHLADVRLVNYKVRILDEDRGTRAVTRVLLDSTDGHRTWGAVGVSENIIEASWQALVDSLEYAEQPAAEQPQTAGASGAPPGAEPR